MKSKRRVFHLVGVAGVGMSALAEVLLAAGCRVSGSDRYMDQGRNLDVLKALESAGVDLFPQDGSGIRPNLNGVVISSAIEEENSDFLAAKRQGLPLIHRAEMLADLLAGKSVIAVAGTAGKTTVTGMIGWILSKCGLDPNVVNGGAVLGWQSESATGSTRKGDTDLWVVEVDESDRSLLKFSPQRAVITNISSDHFDLKSSIDLFRNFSKQVSTDLVCGPGVAEQLGRDAADQPTPICRAGGWEFRLFDHLFRVPVPGEHNAQNAMLAVRMAVALGVSPEDTADALRTFPGIHRRLEHVGCTRGVTVVDDYAHNPAKIAAAWRAFDPRKGRVLGIWRPHGFGPLALMQDDLAVMLKKTMRNDDMFYVLPVYYAGGTATRTLTAKDFVDHLQQVGVRAEWVEGYSQLKERLLAEVQEGDYIIYMGARDPEISLAARRLCTSLESES